MSVTVKEMFLTLWLTKLFGTQRDIERYSSINQSKDTFAHKLDRQLLQYLKVYRNLSLTDIPLIQLQNSSLILISEIYVYIYLFVYVNICMYLYERLKIKVPGHENHINLR